MHKDVDLIENPQVLWQYILDIIGKVMAEKPVNKGGFHRMEAYKQEFIEFMLA